MTIRLGGLNCLQVDFALTELACLVALVVCPRFESRHHKLASEDAQRGCNRHCQNEAKDTKQMSVQEQGHDQRHWM